ncbi:MAG: hypothetical protein GY711_05410 [bacterium]|nr:hypothetical protein [bacterium]
MDRCTLGRLRWRTGGLPVPFSTILTVCALLTTSAAAQQTIDEVFGAQAGDGFGTSVAFVGDLDHDGMADFAVGAPGDDNAGAQAGSVSVFSGADRSSARRWTRCTGCTRQLRPAPARRPTTST